MITKSINFTEKDYNLINSHAEKMGISFSEYVKSILLKNISKNEEMTLSEALYNYCDFVSKEEQEEIDSLNIDWDNTDGVELKIE